MIGQLPKVAVRQRSKRIEPAQEGIVSEKDALNERISKLITFLIELKRGMNGGPAPGIGVPKYKLTEPMPDQVPSSAQRAEQELDSIVEALRGIDAKQDQYAAEKFQQLNDRVQKMQELQQTAEVQFQFHKLASSKLSRLWAHVAAPFSFSERGRWERLRLLRALSRVSSNLKDLEDTILSGTSSVFDALQEGKSLYLDAKSSFFEEYRNNLNKILNSTLNELETIEDKVNKDSLTGISMVPGPDTPLKSSPTAPKGDDDPDPNDPQGPKGSTEETSEIIEAIKDLKDSIKSVVVAPSIPSETTQDTGEPKEAPEIVSPEISQEGEYAESLEEEVPDPSEIEKGHAEFMFSRAQQSYSDAQKAIGESYQAPEPWGSRLRQQWQSVNAIVNAFQNSQSRNEMVSNYLLLMKAIGDVRETLSVMQKGLDSSIDEERMNQQALEFMNQYKDELQERFGKVAQASNRFGSWFKRMLTNLSSSKDKHLRLKIAKEIREARSGLSKMMDNLEKRNIDFRSLFNDSTIFYDSIIDVYEKLADLGEMYNSQMRREKAKKKYDKERFKYEMIPAGDINSMKKIMKDLHEDKRKVMELSTTEERISNLYSMLEDIENEE